MGLIQIPYRRKPEYGRLRVNWNDPITRGLLFAAYPGGNQYWDLVSGAKGTRQSSVSNAAGSRGSIARIASTGSTDNPIQFLGSELVARKLAGQTTLTMMVRAKITAPATASYNALLSIAWDAGGGNPYYFCSLYRTANGTRLELDHATSSSAYLDPNIDGVISVGNWATYTAVKTASSVAFYRDGVLIGSSANTATLTTPTEFRPVTIFGGGWNQGTYNETNEGDVEFAGIWNRALTQAEVGALSDNSYRLIRPLPLVLPPPAGSSPQTATPASAVATAGSASQTLSPGAVVIAPSSAGATAGATNPGATNAGTIVGGILTIPSRRKIEYGKLELNRQHRLTRNLAFLVYPGGSQRNDLIRGIAPALSGSATWQGNGPFGSAVEATGTDALLVWATNQIATLLGGGTAFTFAIGFRPTAYGINASATTFFGLRDSNNVRAGFLASGNTSASTLSISYNDDANVTYTSAASLSNWITLGESNLWVGVRDGTVARIYKDGKLALDSTITSVATSSTANPLVVNQRRNGADTRAIPGQIWFLAIWPHALSQSDAKLLSDNPFALVKPRTVQFEYVSGTVNQIVVPPSAAATAAATDPILAPGALTISSASGAATAGAANQTLAATATIAPASAVASAVGTDPSLVAGAVSVAPASAIASGAATNPTLSAGAVTITIASAQASAVGTAPSLVAGALTISPASAQATATGTNPSLIPGAVSISPASAQASAAITDPLLLSGGTIAPASGQATATATDPSLSAGAVSIAPGSAQATAIGTDPTLSPGNSTISPASGQASAVGTSPTLSAGSATIAPASAVATGAATNPNLAATASIQPSSAQATAGATDPALITGGVLLPASAIASASAASQALSPGAVTVSPGSGTATAGVTDPTLATGSTLAPASAVASAIGSDPTLTPGSVTASPASAQASAVGSDPTLAPGIVIIAPASGQASAVGSDPSLVRILIPASAIASALAGNPVLLPGGVVVAPSSGAATATASTPILAYGTGEGATLSAVSLTVQERITAASLSVSERITGATLAVNERLTTATLEVE